MGFWRDPVAEALGPLELSPALPTVVPRQGARGLWATPVPQAVPKSSGDGVPFHRHRGGAGDAATLPRPPQGAQSELLVAVGPQTITRMLALALRGRDMKMGG